MSSSSHAAVSLNTARIQTNSVWISCSFSVKSHNPSSPAIVLNHWTSLNTARTQQYSHQSRGHTCLDGYCSHLKPSSQCDFPSIIVLIQSAAEHWTLNSAGTQQHSHTQRTLVQIIWNHPLWLSADVFAGTLASMVTAPGIPMQKRLQIWYGENSPWQFCLDQTSPTLFKQMMVKPNQSLHSKFLNRWNIFKPCEKVFTTIKYKSKQCFVPGKEECIYSSGKRSTKQVTSFQCVTMCALVVILKCNTQQRCANLRYRSQSSYQQQNLWWASLGRITSSVVR